MYDESGAPWPYDPPEEADEDGEPTWECPEGICECHPPEGTIERRPHKIFFHDERAKRLDGARCRVFENGKLINLDSPWADGGAVSVDVLVTTRSLRLEWAPRELPSGPHYPFRKIYHLDLGDTQDDGLRRRLHNIGFSGGLTLDENVSDFRRAYLKGAAGNINEVEAQLVTYHDGGTLTPLPDALQPDDATAPPPPKPAGPPAPPLAPGVQPQGSVAAVQLLNIIVKLASRYMLTMDGFKLTGVDWDRPDESEELKKAHKYDLTRMVQELGGQSSPASSGGRPKPWRWTNRSNRLIDGASVTLTVAQDPSFSTVVERTEVTKGGQAVFKLVRMNFANFPLGKPANAFLRVEPRAGQLSQGPAGPYVSTKYVTEDFQYRPFTVAMHFNPSGVLVADSVMIIGNERPAYAAVVSTLPIGSTPAGFVIELDWKPDWMRGRQNPRTSKTRFTDPLATAGAPGVIEPMVVLHLTANANVASGTLDGFYYRSASERKVSAHYVVDLDGHAIKMVDESAVSWHANPSVWQSRNAANEYSVGIEIVHTNGSDIHESDNARRARRFTEEQIATVKRICRGLVDKYKIPPSRVVGHSDIIWVGSMIDFRADPSEMFDWEALENDGSGICLKRREYDGADQAVIGLRNAKDTIEKYPKRSPSGDAKVAREAAILKIKEFLFEIGYAVAPATPVPGSTGPTQALSKPVFSPGFDEALFAAVRAFQFRYFSGRRRRYKSGAPPPEPAGDKKPGPPVGTLDPETIRAIIDVWWDRKKRG